MSANPSLHEAIHLYREAQLADGVPRGTVDQYGGTLKRLEKRFQGRQFGGITTQDIAQFLYGPGGILVGKASSTGTTYRAALRSFFNYGHLVGWSRSAVSIPSAPFKKSARGAKPEHAPTRFTEGELRLMLDKASHPVLRGMVAVAISTALRISDIRKIKCTEVNFQTGDLYVWVQKTGRFDAMPITLDLEEEVRRYLSWYTGDRGNAAD
ncbi:tyrosine-type recombinase/integrase [Streptomyces sp. NPDC002666]